MKLTSKEGIERALRDSFELPNRVAESVPHPLVSVKVLTHNHVDFIDRCIQGILMQRTDFPFEVLIGEDFSTDGTREKVYMYAAKHPDLIRVVTSEFRAGVKANSVRTLKRVRGRYIANLDGDDYWTDPEKLQIQVTFMERNPECIISYHDFLIEDMASGTLSPSPLSNGDRRDVDRQTLRACDIWIKTNTICYRNVVEMHTQPEYLHILNGDNFLTSMLGEHGYGKWLGDSIRPSVYRRHRGGIWSSLDDVDKIATQIHSYFWIGRYHLRNGDHRMAAVWRQKAVALLERGLPVPETDARNGMRRLRGDVSGPDRRMKPLWGRMMDLLD